MRQCAREEGGGPDLDLATSTNNTAIELFQSEHANGRVDGSRTHDDDHGDGVEGGGEPFVFSRRFLPVQNEPCPLRVSGLPIPYTARVFNFEHHTHTTSTHALEHRETHAQTRVHTPIDDNDPPSSR